ncbi:MAG: hypothetical protein AUG00_00240 [Candidatus Rokubacteria bacterium 13_1_20CM_2_70_7]|nr:MAG: hypothetical protein AUG00_00240 [Candidatus Rokubacteria bacterium 13_1_20CM_2_70_7]
MSRRISAFSSIALIGLLGRLEPVERSRQLGIEPLDLTAGPPLPLGDQAQGHRRQAGERGENEPRRPADPGWHQPRRERIEPAGDERGTQAHPRTEVVGVDRDQREEEEVEKAVAAAGEVEEREDEQEIDAERVEKDDAGGAGIDRDQREDANLVRREPRHQREQIDLVAGPQGDEAESRQAPYHHDGEKDGEHPLVALEQLEDRVPRLAASGRHGPPGRL